MNEPETEPARPDDSLGNSNHERQEMRFLTPTILAGLLAGGALSSFGQAPEQRGPDGPPHRPPPPLITALDLNKDGVISADEIAKAAESLKKLDKNGDGQLTPDELRPPRPQGDRGPDHRPAPEQAPADKRAEGSR
jgi:hypothetical protein